MSLKHKPASPSQPLPMLKNVGAAPMVYFDTVPVYGTFGGTIEIEIAARMLMPKPDGSVFVDMASAAHLRCSPGAALQLAASLQNAVEMHKKQMEQQSAVVADDGDDKRETLHS